LELLLIELLLDLEFVVVELVGGVLLKGVS